ncbi:MAG: PAS domain S-box protein [Acidobacteria bacterium]|nr:PAS domain S-box protein [Acidobacteriota bacterium]
MKTQTHARSDPDLRGKLYWVVISRIAVLVPLLVLAATLLTRFAANSLAPFWVAICALSLFHLASLQFLPNPATALYLQIVTDELLITLLIYCSADLNSIFIPLYLLVIIYSCILGKRRGGVLATTLSLFAYLSVISFGDPGGTPLHAPAPALNEATLRVVLNLLSFAGVGLLGIHLCERLQAVRVKLGSTEDSLAELQSLHQNMIHSIRSGLFTTDRQGRITSLNPAGVEITRHAEADILGRPCSVLIGESGLKRLLRADFTRLKRALRHEVWVRDALGRWRYLGFSASSLLSQSRGTLGFITSFQDLTEIKKLEEEVRLKEKMAAIGNLVAGIAHELRNPLGAISGSVQVLKGEMEPAGDRARLLNIVLRESDRLNKIVEDLLCYASPRDPKRVPVALDRLLEETLQLARNDPTFTHHRIHLENAAEQPCCFGNPDQIKQVFWNLITNAAKAMPAGGDLTIRMAHTDRFVKIAFQDHGIGMTRLQRLKMFQPFTGAFATGMGLGMVIVYQIVQRHRGLIAVRSRKYRGTTVMLSLPRARPPVSEFPVSQLDAAASDRKD